MTLVLVKSERCPETKAGEGEPRVRKEEQQSSAGGFLQRTSGARSL